jgi:hypothetical protein
MPSSPRARSVWTTSTPRRWRCRALPSDAARKTPRSAPKSYRKQPRCRCRQSFPVEQRIEVSAHKTPYVRFDLNDYSIPHTHVRRTLVVLASLDTVRIVDGQTLIAAHPRTFDRGQQVEVPAHLEALTAHKRAARSHRAKDRLQHAAASAKLLFLRAAEHGVHLGVLTRGLLDLLDSHGPAALEPAIVAALNEDAAHLGAVRHFVDHHAQARGQAPPIAVTLPDDPRVRALSVRPHPLSDYQHLTAEPTDECTNPDDPHP